MFKTSDAQREYQRNWRHRNRDRHNLLRRVWYRKNKDKILKKSKEWQFVNKERCLKRRHQRTEELKEKILRYYGGGSVECVLCGENRIPTLSIDHIDGGGTKHRKETGIHGGKHMYRWLEKENFPLGYRTLCMNCQFVEKEKLKNKKKAPTV